MLFLIIILPLLGFFSGSLLGRFIGVGASIITTLFIIFSCTLSLFLLYNLTQTSSIFFFLIAKWIVVDSLDVCWAVHYDSLTGIMLVIVTFISSLVHLYSTEYMENDPHLPRFMSYLSLFTFFMLILVTANNFLQLFVGWEGVGVSSFLLINFWFTRIQANKAAIKAMLVNRIGDFFLLLAILTIFFVFNSLDYDVVFSLIPLAINYKIVLLGFQLPVLDLISLLLFGGAMGKSAQLGLHTWLPDAMEGPTPVSALIHAATMVTAGVFLLARCSYIFEFSPLSLNIVVLVGSSTAFFAATTGLFQNDIKKVIAYSTCSQLGYMVFACGLSSYDVGLFHLYNHAFFKALLFLGAGSVIHAMSDEQDMRKMGGLKNLLPFSYAVMLIGSLALMGFPFLAGFYSKDVILEVSYAKHTLSSHFSFILGILAAFCTAFYSIRLLYLVFLAAPNGNKNIILNAHEGTWRMTLPLFLLSILSIFIGFLSKDLFIGFGTSFWGASIFVLPENYLLSDIEFLPIGYKLLPLAVTLLGCFFAYALYRFETFEYFKVKITKKFTGIYHFFNKKWYFDRIYNTFLSQKSLNLSYNYFYITIDRGLLEQAGPNGLLNSLVSLIVFIKKYQTGFIISYLIHFLSFTLLFLFFSLKQAVFSIFVLFLAIYCLGFYDNFS